MTGNICNSLMKAHKPDHEEFESKIFGGLIRQVTKFFRTSSAPPSLNIFVLKILNKIIQDYRSLKLSYESNVVSQDEDDYEDVISGHFDRIHVTKAFVQEVASEANILKPSQSDLTGAKTLFSEYLQAQVELIVGTLLPTARGEKIKSLSDLIELPRWLGNIGVAAQILAYLDSPKNLLFSSIEQECFDQTRLKSQWERVLIVSKLPIDLKRSEIESKILSIAKSHRAIVKDIFIPHGDISSPNSETKKAIQDFLATGKSLEDAHKAAVKDLNEKAEQLEKKKQEEKKPKEKRDKSGLKKNTKKDTKAVKSSDKKEEKEESKEGSNEDTKQDPKEDPKEDPEEEKIVEKEEQEVTEEIKWEEYDHQGAAIVMLDEFDLELLVEADQIPDIEEPEEKDEKPEPEPAAALAVYNCAACTLENSMANESCSICGTPRPADSGQEEQKEDASPAEEEDITKEFEDSYHLAIRNRLKYITNDIKEMTNKLNRDDETLAESRKEEISELQRKLEGTSMLTKKQMEEVKLSLKKVETMSLGNLFEEAEGDDEPANEDKKDQKQDDAKENESKEDAKQEVKEDAKQEVKEEDKKEDQKEEDVKENQKEEDAKEKPLREEVKIFFGNAIDDDYKSEVYLNGYLKNLLLNDDKTLTDECRRIQKEILDNPDNTEFGIEISMMLTEKDLVNLIENDPRKAWEIFEGQGYDLGFELSAYRTPEEYRKLLTISSEKSRKMADFERLSRLIVIDISQNSIISPHFRGNGLKSKPAKHHTYQIDREVVEANYPGLLENTSFREIRYFWALTRLLNKYLHESIYLTYCSETQASSSGQRESFTLSSLISKFRIVIHSIKFYLKQTVLDRTSIDRDKPPELVFERLKIAHFQQERDTEAIEIESLSSDEGDDKPSFAEEDTTESFSSLLYTSYEQMSQADVALLRAKRPQGAEPHLSFTVLFKGEFVVGEGGPYRQFFADLSSEIQPTNFIQDDKDDMPILVPTPNNRAEVKDYKEYWTINPSCVSSQDLALYEYLGVLMGVCIRTNVHLTLNLTTMFWKPLVGESLTFNDLRELDIGFINRIHYMLDTPKEGFEDIIMDNFSISLSDDSIFELKPNGLEEQVTFENKNEFIIKAISVRLQETSLQINAVKKGLCKTIPEGLLNLMTPGELREAVCGKIECDLELLKRNTEYGGTNPKELENSDIVKWLWEVLEEISEEDRLKFIVFCWGQERLPANDEEFKLSKTRFMIKPSINQTYGDGALPKANTCFFNFELPNYSSKEVLRERMLLAIRTDNKSMNAEQQEFMEHQGRNDMFGHHQNEDDY